MNTAEKHVEHMVWSLAGVHWLLTGGDGPPTDGNIRLAAAELRCFLIDMGYDPGRGMTGPRPRPTPEDVACQTRRLVEFRDAVGRAVRHATEEVG